MLASMANAHHIERLESSVAKLEGDLLKLTVEELEGRAAIKKGTTLEP